MRLLFLRILASQAHDLFQAPARDLRMFGMLDRKWTESGPKVDRKWTESGPKVDRKWTESGPKMDRKWTGS